MSRFENINSTVTVINTDGLSHLKENRVPSVLNDLWSLQQLMLSAPRFLLAGESQANGSSIIQTDRSKFSWRQKKLKQAEDTSSLCEVAACFYLCHMELKTM